LEACAYRAAYDYEMYQAFFEDLAISKPDYFLETGSASHPAQTASIMIAFKKICQQEQPDLVMTKDLDEIILGDVRTAATEENKGLAP